MENSQVFREIPPTNVGGSADSGWEPCTEGNESPLILIIVVVVEKTQILDHIFEFCINKIDQNHGIWPESGPGASVWAVTSSG